MEHYLIPFTKLLKENSRDPALTTVATSFAMMYPVVLKICSILILVSILSGPNEFYISIVFYILFTMATFSTIIISVKMKNESNVPVVPPTEPSDSVYIRLEPNHNIVRYPLQPVPIETYAPTLTY